jgi:hypothetical protein
MTKASVMGLHQFWYSLQQDGRNPLRLLSTLETMEKSTKSQRGKGKENAKARGKVKSAKSVASDESSAKTSDSSEPDEDSDNAPSDSETEGEHNKSTSALKSGKSLDNMAASSEQTTSQHGNIEVSAPQKDADGEGKSPQVAHRVRDSLFTRRLPSWNKAGHISLSEITLRF